MGVLSRYRLAAGPALALVVGALGAVAVTASLPARALDDATRSHPSATAPTSDGDRSSGGVANGLGDVKGSGKALFNRAPTDGDPAGSATATEPAAKAPARRPLGLADRRRMRQIAQMHLFEIELAGLATAISGNQTVRAYAVQMLEDNVRARQNLRGLAGRYDVILPGGVESSNAAILRNLVTKTGAQFDADYLAQAGTTLQQQEADFFSDTHKSAESDDMKAYANDQATISRRHLQLASKVMNTLQPAKGADQSSGTTPR